MRLYNWLDLFAARLRWLFVRRRAQRRRRPTRVLPRRAPALSFERLEDRVLLSAPNPVTLGSFNGADGVSILGTTGDGFVGTAVHNLGDVNGDGFEDFAVGTTAGVVHVFFGRADFTPTAGTIDLATPLDGTNGFTITAQGMTSGSGTPPPLAPPVGLGPAVSGGGDFNGDGFHDIVVGLPTWNAAAGTTVNQRGGAFVIFGGSTIGAGGTFSLAGFGQPANTMGATVQGWGDQVVRIDGFQDGARAGTAVNFIGDVNGDGFDDIAIGSYRWDANTSSSPAGDRRGEAYVVFGKFVGRDDAASGAGWKANSLVDLNNLGSNGFRLTGADDADDGGWAVAGVGDVNGDGFHDFAVTSRRDDNTEANAGTTYVVFGGTALGNLTLAPANFNGTNGVAIHGVGVGDQSGWSVNAAGDVNADGFDDLIIGAPNAVSSGLVQAGQAYVVFGRPTWDPAVRLIDLDGLNGFMIDGIINADQAGISVSGGGDINGDGFDDLIIGAHQAGPNGANFGQAYVIFGRSTGFDKFFRLSDLDGNNGFRLDGLAGGERAGQWVSHAGDVNGDGFDDLLIGAPTATVGASTNVGKAYLFFGGNFTPRPGTQVGDATPNTLTGNQGTGGIAGIDILIGGDANDTLTSDGGPDVLRGARGDDTLVIPDAFFTPTPNGGTRRIQGGTGSNTLVFLADGGTLDLTSIPNNRIQDIHVIDIRGVVHLTTYGTGNNTLMISPREILYLSRYGQQIVDPFNTRVSESQLFVRRDAGDQVLGPGGISLQAAGFSRGADFLDTTISSITYGVTFQRWTANFGTTGRVVLFVEDPAVISPLQLNGDKGVRLVGASNAELAGGSVSGAGDINGDGYDDFLIGAYTSNVNGVASGRVYVVFGKETGFPTGIFGAVGLGALNGTDGFIINGLAAGDRLGSSVAGVGDVNGDGFADFVIGAHTADPAGRNSAGESYLIFGSATIGAGGTFNLASLDGINGVRIRGINMNDYSGFAVGKAGDINGDGLMDVVIGAFQADPGAPPGVDAVNGETYVVFGRTDWSATGGTFELSSLNGTNGIRLQGITDGDHSGFSVRTAGDVNGDGIDDLVVGAPSADKAGPTLSVGHSYVVFGRADWSATAGIVALSSLNGTNGFRIVGIDPYDLSGRSVSSAGDINGDGFADILIGTPRAEDGYSATNNRGEAYVVFGKATGFAATFDLATLNGTNGFTISHPSAGSYLGWSVSGMGDFNGDGFDDILVGAPRASAHGQSRAGQGFVLFGKADWSGTPFISPQTDTPNGLNTGLAGFRIDGLASNDYLGVSVSGAGDVNGDGFDDLLIAAHQAEQFAGGSNRGEVYLIFGGPDTFLGTSRPQYIGGGTNLAADRALRMGDNTNADFFAPPLGPGNRDIFVGFQGHDDFTSLGGPDVFRGGQGNDFFRLPDTNFSGNRVINGGNGVDLLALTGAGQTLHLTTLPNTQIQNIEIIDIRGSGANSLVLSPQEVLNLSAGGRHAVVGAFTSGSVANVLMVLQDRDDTVSRGSGWTQGPISAYLTINTNNAGGTRTAFFDVFTSGNARLLLETQTVVQQGTTLSVIGTGQDDAFTYDAVTKVLTISTNGGPATSYDLSLIPGWDNITIDGGGGNDSVFFTGTALDDVVDLTPTSIRFEYDAGHVGFEVTTTSVEVFRGFAGAGGTADLVRLAGSGQTLNLTGALGAALTNVEIVDITGTGNNTFTLDLAAVQANDVAPLTVLRNLGDTVTGLTTAAGWTLGANALWDAGRSSFFESYTNGAEQVLVQDVLFTRTGSTGAFIGTSGDDVFAYNAFSHVVTVNGVAYDLTQPGGIDLVTLDGLAGNDQLSLLGTAGDDLVVVTPTSIQFEFNSGHAGFELTTSNMERLAAFDGQGHVSGDEIRLPGAGQTLNLTGAGGTTLMNLELIDVRGTGANTLTLDFAAATTNVSTPLTVLRDPDDTVNIGSGWTLTTATWDAGRQTYFENYTQGGQTLRLQTGAVVVAGSQANVFGTSLNDLFVYDAVTQVMLINGVAYDLSAPGGVNKINVDGQAGVDEIRVLGTAGADLMEHTTATTTRYDYSAVPGFDLTAVNVEQRSLDGRGGTDTIILPGANQVLDLTSAPGNLNKNIEFINITGSGNNALILNPTAAVNNVSTPLTVNRNNGDVVNIGAGWTLSPLAFFDGAKFYEVFTASGQTLQVESLQVTVSGNTANVKGTGGNDSFTYDAQTNVVTVNGVSYQLPGGVTRVNLDGLAGTDTLNLLGTPGNDRVVLHPGTALMDFNPGQAGFDFVAGSVETINVDGRGEAGGIGDSVTMYDSSGDDQLTVNLTTATMTGPGLNYGVTGFEQIVAASIRGGHDRAMLSDSAGDDVFSASPTVANLTGPGYVNQVSGFRQVTANATGGGFDRAFLTDSAGTDTFNANAATGVASLSGAGFLNSALGFEAVSGQAVFPNGGQDTAFLNDSPGNDKFVSRMNVSFLNGGGVLHEAVGFEVVSGRATAGGFDQAFFHDSAGDDTFTGSSLSGSIVPNTVLPGPGQYREAVGFDIVAAWSLNGGRDRATLFDTPGNDVVSIRPTAANFSANGQLYLQALGFTFVTARSNSGGTDFAFLFDSAGDDAFVGRPTTATLYAQGPVPAFVSEAIGFAAVSARASTGNDLATLFDSSGDDIFTSNARTGLATMRGTGFFNETVGFRQVFAYASGGTDRANLTDSTGVDTFFGRGVDGRLSGPGFSHVASAFEFVSIFSPDGPANLLDIANLSYVFNRSGTWNPV